MTPVEGSVVRCDALKRQREEGEELEEEVAVESQVDPAEATSASSPSSSSPGGTTRGAKRPRTGRSVEATDEGSLDKEMEEAVHADEETAAKTAEEAAVAQSAGPATLGKLLAVQPIGPPDFGGQLIDYLWGVHFVYAAPVEYLLMQFFSGSPEERQKTLCGARRIVAPELPALLRCSRSIRLGAIAAAEVRRCVLEEEAASFSGDEESAPASPDSADGDKMTAAPGSPVSTTASDSGASTSSSSSSVERLQEICAEVKDRYPASWALARRTCAAPGRSAEAEELLRRERGPLAAVA